MSAELDKLRAADWEIVELADRIRIRRAGNDKDVFAEVMKNADGTLHLVTARSAFHRELAGIIAKPSGAVEGADYVPRTYGS